MTALDLISASMRLIGALAVGETPTQAEQQDMLVILNGMVDAWNADRLMIFTIPRQVFTLVPGQQVYAYGPGGDFNAPRAPKIDRISIINLSNQGQPLELPISYLTTAQWQAVPVKNVQSALPLQVWDDNAFPLRNLTYWPIPNTQVKTAIYPWMVLTQFSDLVSQVTFPPGYFEALKYNLAVRAHPEFWDEGHQLPPLVGALALSSLAAVRAINMPIIDLRCDSAVVNPKAQVYNWLSDTYISK